MNRPPPGTMVWWRFRGAPSAFKFGYCTYLDSPSLVRMGAYNGDSHHGPVVDCNEIEWRPYR